MSRIGDLFLWSKVDDFLIGVNFAIIIYHIVKERNNDEKKVQDQKGTGFQAGLQKR